MYVAIFLFIVSLFVLLGAHTNKVQAKRILQEVIQVRELAEKIYREKTPAHGSAWEDTVSEALTTGDNPSEKE